MLGGGRLVNYKKKLVIFFYSKTTDSGCDQKLFEHLTLFTQFLAHIHKVSLSLSLSLSVRVHIFVLLCVCVRACLHVRWVRVWCLRVCVLMLARVRVCVCVCLCLRVWQRKANRRPETRRKKLSQ